MHEKPKFPKPAELARILSQAGGESITAAQIEANIEDGAPTTGDGEVNIVFYVAWILKNDNRRRKKAGSD